MFTDYIHYIAPGLLLVYAIQLYNWYGIFLRINLEKKYSKSPTNIGLSVIISFREKVEILPTLIKNLSQQSYENFEVLIVNDGPVSQPNNLLSDWASGDERFRYLKHKKNTIGKKSALEFGIKNASNNWLVFTDIDCEPGDNWLEIISKSIPDHPSILLGVSPYKKKPGLLNKVIQGETFITAIQYLGWAQKGKAYMGVGRNLIYHRQVFEKYKFDSHRNIPFGDDDLLVNEAGKEFPIYILPDTEAMTYSAPPITWSEWYGQKSRHLSAGKFYTLKTQIRISIFNFSLALEKLLLLILIFSSPVLAIIFILCKALFLIYPINKLKSSIGMISSLTDWLAYEWFHSLYLVFMSPYIFFKTKRKW